MILLKLKNRGKKKRIIEKNDQPFLSVLYLVQTQRIEEERFCPTKVMELNSLVDKKTLFCRGVENPKLPSSYALIHPCCQSHKYIYIPFPTEHNLFHFQRRGVFSLFCTDEDGQHTDTCAD